MSDKADPAEVKRLLGLYVQMRLSSAVEEGTKLDAAEMGHVMNWLKGESVEDEDTRDQESIQEIAAAAARGGWTGKMPPLEDE
jgi:hypothetical protein